MRPKSPVLFPFLAVLALAAAALACAPSKGLVATSARTSTPVPATQAIATAATATATSGQPTAATSGQPTATTAAAAATATATSGQPTATAAAATSTSSVGDGAPAPGGPSDVPVMPGDKTNLVGTANLVAYQTKAAGADVVAFYKAAMPKNGWAVDPTRTAVLPDSTVLAFTKDTRFVLVAIGKDTSGSQTAVAIAIQ